MRCATPIRLSSLGLQVLTAYVAGALVSIALAVAAAVWVVQHDVLAGLELAERAQSLATKVRFDGNGKPLGIDAREVDLDWLYDSLHKETAYRVLDANSQVALLSPAGAAFWQPDAASANSTGGGPRLAVGGFNFVRNGITLHGTTEPFEHQGQRWYLQYAASERLRHLIQHKFALPFMGGAIGLFSALLIIGFGLCAYLALRYALKPLKKLSESAAAIAPHALHARLSTEALPLEISPLVESFNRALERLERGYRLQQEFIANAAHELKTPLALIRAQVELSETKPSTRAALLGDIEVMSRQVQQLLLLAEASEAQNYRFDTVPVHDVALEATAYLQRMAHAADVGLTVTATSTAIWQADRGALFTLLKNLVENAIQHAPAQTSVVLTIDTTTITVRDFGPGVTAAQLPLMFERFWRAAHRQDHGAGLGLAICQEIVVAHGWQLTAQRAEPGLRLQLTNGHSIDGYKFNSKLSISD
jgi:two-component system, OmpR family, sensor histidine kinase QseC